MSAPSAELLLMTKRAADAATELATARNNVPVGGRWRHKKGGLYVVRGHALCTDDGTARVLYQRYGGPGFDGAVECETLYARPLSEWSMDRFVPVEAGA